MNIQNYDKCVQYVLNLKGLAATSFKGAGLRVFERFDYNPKAIFSAVGKGGIVMPIVDSRIFEEGDGGLTYTVITTVNRARQAITLFNPFASTTMEQGLEAFLEQWTKNGSDCITAFQVDEKTYLPRPADLSHVNLPEDLKELCEAMAENAHDAWAMERQSEGWTYGPKRDDNLLQTPDMRPYAELPETEKQYDRIMATSTIKLLLALGYKIQKA